MESIVTVYGEFCTICGRKRECVHHLIPGSARRALCDADGLKIPLCNKCHNMSGKDSVHGTGTAEQLSRMVGQLAWEKQYIKDYATEHGYDDDERNAFRRRYGKSFL